MLGVRNTVIWIRHAEKAYDNGKGPPGSHQHDPSLKPDVTEGVTKRGAELIIAYGPPTMCIVSPYRRTRETLAYLLAAAGPEYKVPTYKDTNIAEYLGNQRPYRKGSTMSTTPLVEPDTLTEGLPPIGESMQALAARASVHVDHPFLNIEEAPEKSQVIWVVTHGIVCTRVYETLMSREKVWRHCNVCEIDADGKEVKLHDATLGKKPGLVARQSLWGKHSPQPLGGLAFTYTVDEKGVRSGCIYKLT